MLLKQDIFPNSIFVKQVLVMKAISSMDLIHEFDFCNFIFLFCNVLRIKNAITAGFGFMTMPQRAQF